MNRDRRGESRQVLGNVRDRHEAIQKIERQMIELAELFQDMERMVVEQEPMVEQIETGAVETNQNIQKGNTELSGGIEKARAARKKKWICFWICGKFSEYFIVHGAMLMDVYSCYIHRHCDCCRGCWCHSEQSSKEMSVRSHKTP